MKPGEQILSTVEICWAEAIWVFAAHVYAVLMPLALCVAVSNYWDYLLQTTHDPFLFYVAVGLFCAGSAFEVAQNAADKWYLTSEVGSANGVGLCDFLFYWLVTSAQAVCALAISGNHPWVVAIAAGAVVVYPVLYFVRFAHFAPLIVSNLLVVVLAYWSFGDPIVFMQPILAAVTIYFFAALLKTGAQVIHGFTTIAAASGTWFLVWALHNGAMSTPNSWMQLFLLIAVVAVAAAALWPLLMMLPTSERIIRQPEELAHAVTVSEPPSRHVDEVRPAKFFQPTSGEGDINA